MCPRINVTVEFRWRPQTGRTGQAQYVGVSLNLFIFGLIGDWGKGRYQIEGEARAFRPNRVELSRSVSPDFCPLPSLPPPVALCRRGYRFYSSIADILKRGKSLLMRAVLAPFQLHMQHIPTIAASAIGYRFSHSVFFFYSSECRPLGSLPSRSLPAWLLTLPYRTPARRAFFDSIHSCHAMSTSRYGTRPNKGTANPAQSNRESETLRFHFPSVQSRS